MALWWHCGGTGHLESCGWCSAPGAPERNDLEGRQGVGMRPFTLTRSICRGCGSALQPHTAWPHPKKVVCCIRPTCSIAGRVKKSGDQLSTQPVCATRLRARAKETRARACSAEQWHQELLQHGSSFRTVAAGPKQRWHPEGQPSRFPSAAGSNAPRSSRLSTAAGSMWRPAAVFLALVAALAMGGR